MDRLHRPTQCRERLAAAPLTEGADPARFPQETPAYRLRNLGRKVGRLAAPIGAWVEFDGPVVETLRQAQAHWDGSGVPEGLAGLREDVVGQRVVGDRAARRHRQVAHPRCPDGAAIGYRVADRRLPGRGSAPGQEAPL